MRSFFFIVCLLAGFPAAAMEFARHGNTLVLTGEIRDGDQYKFREFLAGPLGQGIRVIHLASPGGKVSVARDLARDIRAAGLTTVVDASRHACNSACTGIFAAGVRRHYINAGRVADGEGAMRSGTGLGFHEGNSVGQHGRGYSGGATAGMINIYYEMGVPGASQLVTKAAFNRIYRISGNTALSLGVATSLTPP